MADSKLEYRELLRDRRWQKKRLEVMERAGFKCQNCAGDDNSTLNVHHRRYIKDHKPWEYELEDLQCLCEKCHSEVSESMQHLKLWAGRLESYDLEILVGLAAGMALANGDYLFRPKNDLEAMGLYQASHLSGRCDDLPGRILFLLFEQLISEGKCSESGAGSQIARKMLALVQKEFSRPEEDSN